MLGLKLQKLNQVSKSGTSSDLKNKLHKNFEYFKLTTHAEQASVTHGYKTRARITSIFLNQ